MFIVSGSVLNSAGVDRSCAFAFAFMQQVKHTSIPVVHSAFESSLTTACLVGTPDLLRCQAQLLRQLPELRTWPAVFAAELPALLSARQLSQAQPECCSISDSSYRPWPQIGQDHSVTYLPLLPCCLAHLAAWPSLPTARKHHCNAKALHLSFCSRNICCNMQCSSTSQRHTQILITIILILYRRSS